MYVATEIFPSPYLSISTITQNLQFHLIVLAHVSLLYYISVALFN